MHKYIPNGETEIRKNETSAREGIQNDPTIHTYISIIRGEKLDF